MSITSSLKPDAIRSTWYHPLATWMRPLAHTGLARQDQCISLSIRAHRLIVARNVLTGEIKHFVSNAPPSVPLRELVQVAFIRWAVERCFQDAKEELGLSPFEVRNLKSLRRHTILTGVSFLLLAKTLMRRRGCRGCREHGRKPAQDDLPVAAGTRGAHSRELAGIT